MPVFPITLFWTSTSVTMAMLNYNFRLRVNSFLNAESRKRSVSTVSFMDEPADPNKQGSSVKLEPTYQMEPTKRFPVNTVKDILGEVLQHYLAEEKYEPELCKQMTKTISDVVKARVKELQLGRYKIIALVHIGELRDQGLKISSRCLWDAAHDNSSSYEFRNNSLFATAMVFGIYHE
ncbi:tctex1 domain-containing protein 1-B-like isoform X3 [Acanthaster planci]|uniref:Tctex1 domain-containing protein 1-B-like isoform X3 n=1 Tax=Acanthaster planci TaxID=133434 RepID=A0A8B8A1J7_ACAPL|nr:tctex1 domain-containing protein 1-B-like isoform X3 [Acanthaster planci]